MTRFFDVAGGVAYRGLKKVATNPQLLLPSLIFPMFFFVAFAGGLSSVGDVPGFDFPSGYTAFQFVFVLLQASAFGGVFTGFAIARDLESGFSRRMMLAASNRGGIIGGYWLAALARALFTVTIVNACLGMLVGLGVSLVGMNNAILWGVVAALLNYIPYFGPAAGVAILIAAATARARPAVRPQRKSDHRRC